MSSRGLASDRRTGLGQARDRRDPRVSPPPPHAVRQAVLRTSGWSPDRSWRSTALTPAAG